MRTQLYLTPADHGRPLTLDEFQTADSLEGHHYELINGRLEVSPVPNLPHDGLRDWLARKLYAYGLRHPDVLNEVKAPARVFVPDRPETTAPEPDVAGYRGFPHHLPLAEWRWQDACPIVVAEVVSEDNADKDLVRNVQLYREVPTVREYWILDPRESPDRPTLTVYRKRGGRWQRPVVVKAGETYTTKLLPEFALVVDPHV